jgi:uncharacterized membrane protein
MPLAHESAHQTALITAAIAARVTSVRTLTVIVRGAVVNEIVDCATESS